MKPGTFTFVVRVGDMTYALPMEAGAKLARELLATGSGTVVVDLDLTNPQVDLAMLNLREMKMVDDRRNVLVSLNGDLRLHDLNTDLLEEAKDLGISLVWQAIWVVLNRPPPDIRTEQSGLRDHFWTLLTMYGFRSLRWSILDSHIEDLRIPVEVQDIRRQRLLICVEDVPHLSPEAMATLKNKDLHYVWQICKLRTQQELRITGLTTQDVRVLTYTLQLWWLYLGMTFTPEQRANFPQQS